jgi:crotonobetainyl-CoA:carnitine CoA-transferase CaiB-like acyl-CoA transferase
LRVLDFSRFLSGPHCTRALADLGADVVKVETPEGDFTQNIPPHAGAFSRFYTQQNAGKRNVCIDLRHEEAGPLMLRLLPHFDVLVENFRPGVMAAMGLDYDACRAVNPRLVYASISGWGQDGPETERGAFAIVVHAEAGLLARHKNAYAALEMVSDPFSHADLYSGLETVAGILAALLQRERTGEGQHVDVAMMSTALAINEHANAELTPDWPVERVNRAPIMRFAGEDIALVADPVEPISFGRLVKALGDPSLAEEPRFADQPAREANRSALLDLVQQFLDSFEKYDELESALGAVHIPIGRVQTVRDLASGAWATYREAIVEVSDRQGGTIKIPNAPWRFSGATAGVAGGPSWRGEHNRDVLAEAGIGDQEVARFEADRVLIGDSQSSAAR